MHNKFTVYVKGCSFSLEQALSFQPGKEEIVGRYKSCNEVQKGVLCFKGLAELGLVEECPKKADFDY